MKQEAPVEYLEHDKSEMDAKSNMDNKNNESDNQFINNGEYGLTARALYDYQAGD